MVKDSLLKLLATHLKMIYCAIMYRIIEYVIYEGRFEEFVEALEKGTDFFAEVSSKEEYKRFRMVFSELITKMKLDSFESKQSINQALIEWINVVTLDENSWPTLVSSSFITN